MIQENTRRSRDRGSSGGRGSYRATATNANQIVGDRRKPSNGSVTLPILLIKTPVTHVLPRLNRAVKEVLLKGRHALAFFAQICVEKSCFLIICSSFTSIYQSVPESVYGRRSHACCQHWPTRILDLSIVPFFARYWTCWITW
jgi:hypothetical protein